MRKEKRLIEVSIKVRTVDKKDFTEIESYPRRLEVTVPIGILGIFWAALNEEIDLALKKVGAKRPAPKNPNRCRARTRVY